MKILIIYSSKYGAAEWTARKAQNLLESNHGAECTLVNLRKEAAPAAEGWDGIILGSSVYAGQINRKVLGWAEKYDSVLQKKPLGLFVACLAEGETALKYIESNFPPGLLAHAKIKQPTGGKADFDKMSWIERFIMKKVANINETTDTKNEVSVSKLVDGFMN